MIIKYRGYHGVVSFDADSNIFIGRTIGLNGDEIIFEGETVSELKEDFAAGIDHYLDVFERTGQTVRHP